MKRTTVMLPSELKAKAEQRAREKGLSFGEVVRESLGRYLRAEGGQKAVDSLFADQAVFDGPVPRDLSADHDRYLYDEES
ncbi:MAG: hypothetical protein ACREQY_03830 [Candidatus Binatia bacterium]